MILSDSFSTALAAAHRRDLLAEATRYRTARSAVRARITTRVGRADLPPSSAVRLAGPDECTADRRCAVPR